MKITWNGTGSAWAHELGNSSALVEAEGARLLVDCGHTVPTRLERLGVSLRDVETVFISHLHGDHVYGLEEWGFRALLQWAARPRLLIAAELVPTLWEQVLSGTMRRVAGRDLRLKDYFDVTSLEVGVPRALDPWVVEIRPVRHVPDVPAFGVKLRAGDRAAGFTCDSRADADPWFYDGTHAIFHDCSFAPPDPRSPHAHFEELSAYPAEFRERTLLIHYDDGVLQRSHDPAWRATLDAAALRLAEPLRTITL